MAVANGPCGMYKLQPIYDFKSEFIELPTNMYSLHNIYGRSPDSKHESNELLNLAKQQENLLDKLRVLEMKLMEMNDEIDTDFGTVLEVSSKLTDFPIAMSKYQDIVINANPNHPPLSVWILCRLLKKQSNILLNIHIHSSVISLPDHVKLLEGDNSDDLRTNHQIVITLIWKETVGKDPEMMISPIMQAAIKGEINIARYLARLLTPSYDSGDAVSVTEIDNWLDMAHSSILHGNNKERQYILKTMNSCLGKQDFLVGESMTVADIVMWSALCQTKLTTGLSTNINKWWNYLNSCEPFVMPNEFLY
ncbi:aminoacyl tRNA synthase complex-interacting multifunctional protein 2 [Centruroides vittatus]|uniref:aminoacyl tRNA synthase complex-interacting multifunctional protein 2 n=1 Tax=Centruroides vittatus TaxID=120091 RepID=UPI00350E997B